MAIEFEQEIGRGARPAVDRNKGLPGVALLTGRG